MKIDRPSDSQIPELLSLWKSAFGDYGGFWEMFLDTAFSPDRCRCITENGHAAAALCWFDCACRDQKIAYLYAVVTHPGHRNKGLCRMLLEDVHAYLAANGYSSAMLVPEQEGLRQMYRKLGYRDCTTVSEISCTAAEVPIPLRAIGAAEYGQLRREFLPEGGIVQEGENLVFLAQQAQFYAGENVLLAAYEEEGTLFGMELLGDPAAAPGILTALGCQKGRFRTPGTDKPYAMICPLAEDAVIPSYFGFAFD